MKTIKFFVVLLAVTFAFGCKNSDQVKDEAQASVETPAVTDPNAAATPAVTDPNLPAIPTGPTTSVKWEQTDFDFGKVTEGEVVKHTYKFTNTGSEPLIVTDARSTCGCTVPKKPTEPIPPGETGEITVEFNSRSRVGQQSKPIHVTAHTNPASITLTLKGEVLKGEAQ